MSQNYSLFDYGGMIGPQSQGRVDAYAEALRRTVTPDSVVLDLGAGPGFYALLAARLGARHVYAIEPNDAIRFGPRLAAANGVDDRITFLQDLSTNITLPERADIIHSDIGGALPWLGEHIPALVDARERLLAPGGLMIPKQTWVFAAVVTAAALYEQHVAPWGVNRHGLDLSLARSAATNHMRKSRFAPQQLLTEPACFAHLDYFEIVDPNCQAEIRFTIRQAGVAHGLCLWFDSNVFEEIAFSNAPDKPAIAMYSQLFFPWTASVFVEEGDCVETKLGFHLNRGHYVLSWANRVSNPGGTKAHFRQAQLPQLPLGDIQAARAA